MIDLFDIYKNPSIYDDQYWWKRDDVEFYKHIIDAGKSALELGAGTGRLAFPLLRNEVEYYGLDLSQEFCKYTKDKLLSKEHKDQIIYGDMRSFKIDKKFDYIFIAFNTLLHILTNQDAQKCFRCIRKHLKPGGEFIFDIVNPHPMFLYRSSEKILVMDFKDSMSDEIIEIYESCKYEPISEICDISWEYRYKSGMKKSKRFDYKMRMYFPDTINRLLIENNFKIKDMYGDYDMGSFGLESHVQIYRCV